MAKKKQDEAREAAQAPKSGWNMGHYIGIALFAVALAVYYFNAKWQNDYAWWGGIIGMGVGASLWYLSGLPREQQIEWLRSGLFAITLALLIRWPIGEPYRIPSGSMEPTLHGDPGFGKGDRVWVNKWIYGVRVPFMNKRIWHGQKPQRWDIVVFKTTEKDAVHKTLVKRVVGLPGEKVRIGNDGLVYINDKPLPIPNFLPEGQYYTRPSYIGNDPFDKLPSIPWEEKRPMFGLRTEPEFSIIPEGHYFLMGDNSASSRDGRWFGWMPEDNIVGRVACIWWPFWRWDDFTGFSHTWWWRIVVTILMAFLFMRLFVGRSWCIRDDQGRAKAHLFISYFAYGFRVPFTKLWPVMWDAPKRGQHVIYMPQGPDIPSGAILHGLVAGLPGEKVSFEEERLLVDGKALGDIPELDAMRFTAQQDNIQYGQTKSNQYSRVPDGCYFIVSNEPINDDGEILDGRVLGWTPRDTLLGAATFSWWPPRKLK